MNLLCPNLQKKWINFCLVFVTWSSTNREFNILKTQLMCPFYFITLESNKKWLQLQSELKAFDSVRVQIELFIHAVTYYIKWDLFVFNRVKQYRLKCLTFSSYSILLPVLFLLGKVLKISKFSIFYKFVFLINSF